MTSADGPAIREVPVSAIAWEKKSIYLLQILQCRNNSIHNGCVFSKRARIDFGKIRYFLNLTLVEIQAAITLFNNWQWVDIFYQFESIFKQISNIINIHSVTSRYKFEKKRIWVDIYYQFESIFKSRHWRLQIYIWKEKNTWQPFLQKVLPPSLTLSILNCQ